MPKKSELMPLPIEKIKPGTISDFDIYLLVGGHIVLYSSAMYRWERGELARLHREGHKSLFHLASDLKAVQSYCEITLVSSIDESLDPIERINNITDVAAEFNKILSDNELSRSALRVGQNIAESMVRCIQEDITSVSALGQLINHDEYTFYHSGRVAAYATAIGLKMGLKDSFSLTELSLGCLLHDIGKARIDINILNKPGRLSEEEFEMIKNHPEYGIDMVQEAILTAVPKEIILHHHERLDGSGYPHRLDGRRLLEEVKIASFADCYDALTTNRPYQKARSHFDALDIIKNNLLNALDPEIFAVVVEIMQGKGSGKKAG